MYFDNLPSIDREDLDYRLCMPLFLCYVLLIVPTSTSRPLSGTASVEQAALSSLVPFMC